MKVKKTLKTRLLAMLLAAAMVVTMLPMAAFAEGTDEQALPAASSEEQMEGEEDALPNEIAPTEPPCRKYCIRSAGRKQSDRTSCRKRCNTFTDVKADHTITASFKKGGSGFVSPKTGDASQLLLWELMLATALCSLGMFGFAAYRKRKETK